MRLSKKAEYALRALVALGRKPGQLSMQVEEIAATERIPLKFLEAILLTLRRADLLRSKRGLRGGYQLNVPPNQITVYAVVQLMDGPMQPISCTQAQPQHFGRTICPQCGLPGGCGLGKVFTEVQILLEERLRSLSIAEIIAREAKPENLSFEI
jgi:Rrf2 family protein